MTDRLSPTGFGAVHLGDQIDDARKKAKVPLREGSDALAPCGGFDALHGAVDGLTHDGEIRLVGSRKASVRTDRGLHVGMTLAGARDLYGPPARFTTAPYDPEGVDALWNLGRVGNSVVWLRVLTHKEQINRIEVGFRPEVEFEEGCA